MIYILKCKGNPFTKIRAKSTSNDLNKLNSILIKNPHVVGYEQTIENGKITSYLFYGNPKI